MEASTSTHLTQGTGVMMARWRGVHSPWWEKVLEWKGREKLTCHRKYGLIRLSVLEYNFLIIQKTSKIRYN